MTDIRRTLLWVVFVMSLVLLWDAWNKHNGHPTLFGVATPTAAGAASGAARGAAGASAAGVPAPATAQAVPGAAGPAGVAATSPSGSATALPGEKVTITTDLVKATFDSIGGTLVHLELLAYKDLVDPTRPVVLFDRSDKRVYLAQTGLISAQGGVTLPNHLTPMRVTSSERELGAGHDTLVLRFESAAEGAVRLVKTYTFRRGQYTVGVRHEIVNDGAAAVAPQLYLQLARDGAKPEGESSYYFTFTGPAMYTEEGKYKKFDFKDIAKAGAQSHGSADDGWIAMVQHYFVSAWLLPDARPRDFRTDKVDTPGMPEYYTIAMVQPLGELAPGASRTIDATLMAGPQEEYKLAALAPGLDLVKDYGWLTPLAKPLFWLLDKLHKVLGNWGWAIVALVVLLKIAFYWLNASAYRSMAKMKAVAPRVTELRERFKDKPQQMQQEMMRIYREEKVNPLGGCLPIAVQMPFFIALYWVLLSTVEMRQASWFYITDLAQPDKLFGVLPFIHMPLGPLPLLMTASSLFQVWLNPRPPDPMQARMMWLMPLAFGFMFFFFPAGLVLYWLTNNLLSIAQQWVINRKLGVIGK